MKFSIIVPVFNLEKHICKCIDSLLNQDIEINEYEILIINDGSTDSTELKLSKYTKKYSNVFLYNKLNGGVSSSRNFGIDKATGEYILFVDGDDWLNPDILSEIYTQFKTKDLEALRYGYIKSYINKSLNKSIYIENSKIPTDGLDFIINSKTVEFYPWLYSFSNKFLKENNLKFNINLSFCEDKEFLIRALSLTKKFMNFEFIVYNYNLNRENAVSSKMSVNKIKDLVEANFLIYFYAKTMIHNIKHKEYIKTETLNSIKNSYYILSRNSLWNKFWIWNKLLKNNSFHKKIKVKTFDKLFVLKKSPQIFYIIFYFPRAFYHKIIKNRF
ncbi:glycosyltransferase family 2 protein [Thalassobellus sediminis]|uniref:glycosyltransferase family 2 protein n=1 Tax=Thalassobellus sediminis TaxID=3367753 RepID=UPI0037A3C7F5